MPSFIWIEVRGFILEGCPHCKELYGIGDVDDPNLKTLFSKDCKMKNILKRQKFDIDHRLSRAGIVVIQRSRRGSHLRRELHLRMAQPDPIVDIDIRRIGKFVRDYGKETVKHAIFIDKFELINLSLHTAFQYLFHIEFVPAFMSPYCPYGIMQAVSAKESELELERLLFLGNSQIKPSTQEATGVY